ELSFEELVTCLEQQVRLDDEVEIERRKSRGKLAWLRKKKAKKAGEQGSDEQQSSTNDSQTSLESASGSQILFSADDFLDENDSFESETDDNVSNGYAVDSTRSTQSISMIDPMATTDVAVDSGLATSDSPSFDSDSSDKV